MGRRLNLLFLGVCRFFEKFLRLLQWFTGNKGESIFEFVLVFHITGLQYDRQRITGDLFTSSLHRVSYIFSGDHLQESSICETYPYLFRHYIKTYTFHWKQNEAPDIVNHPGVNIWLFCLLRYDFCWLNVLLVHCFNISDLFFTTVYKNLRDLLRYGTSWFLRWSLSRRSWYDPILCTRFRYVTFCDLD